MDYLDNSQKNKVVISLTAVFFVLLVFFPVYASAQQLSSYAEEILSGLDEETRASIEQTISEIPTGGAIIKEAILGDMKINMSPIYPNVNEKVTVTVVSHLTDLNRANIFWYVNDELKESGTGKSKFNFTTGNAGEVTVIDVVIKTIEGYRVDKKIKITPSELDIIWEAENYTPPFYKGKALLSPKSPLKLIAIPNFITSSGRSVASNNLVYVWRKKGLIIQEKSGYGKNIFYDEAPIPFWEEEISVEVSSLDESLKAYKKITPKLTNPKIIFYEDALIQGVIYESAIDGDFDLSKQELTVKAEPYFFAKRDKEAGNLKYEWSLNSAPVQGEGGRITFRQEAGEGRARINLAVKNIAETLQKSRKTFVLNFKKAGLFNF